MKENKKSLFSAMFILTLVLSFSLVSATPPEININNIEFQDRNHQAISQAKDTGDRILIDVDVSDSDGWRDIRRTRLEWDQTSWIDCNRKTTNINDNSINYLCILTVTPFMNHPTNVDLVVEDIRREKHKFLIDDYDFEGTQFPSYGISPSIPKIEETCTTENICVEYEKECSIKIVDYRRTRERTCSLQTYNITRYTRECSYEEYNITRSRWFCERVDGRYQCERKQVEIPRKKRVCERVEVQIPRTRNICSYNIINVPVERTICETTDVCSEWREQNVCRS